MKPTKPTIAVNLPGPQPTDLGASSAEARTFLSALSDRLQPGRGREGANKNVRTPNPGLRNLMGGILMALITGAADAAILNEPFNNVNTPIPDFNPVGVSFSGVVSDVPAGATVNDLSVGLVVSSGYNGDLYAYLTAPNGTLVTLMNRPGVTPKGSVRLRREGPQHQPAGFGHGQHPNVNGVNGVRPLVCVDNSSGLAAGWLMACKLRIQ